MATRVDTAIYEIIQENDLQYRLWRRVDKASPDGCWIWTGALDTAGYGQIKFHGVLVQVHRIAYASVHGPLAVEGAFLLHRCDNPSCCNPAHLRSGTHSDNMRDMVLKGRQVRGDGHPSRKKLTSADAIAIFKSQGSSGLVAKQYGISAKMVRSIRAGERWACATGATPPS